MTGAQILDLLMFRLGNRTDAALRAGCLLELQSVQKELEGNAFLPWFLKVDDTSVSTTVSQEYASLPTNFLRLDDDWGGVYIDDDSEIDQWRELTREPFANMKSRFRDSSATAPLRFDILADRIYLRPIPDAVYNLRFVGYAADATIADDGNTNLWLTHASDWLLALTGLRIAGYSMMNPELATMFGRDVEVAKQRHLREHHARMMNGQSVQMGDD